MRFREIDAIGAELAAKLTAPALVTLTGDLGAGKTTLTQAICRALGVTEQVTSPTFGLLHEYAGRSARVVHCDLYRLDSRAAVESIGLDELLGDRDTIVIVEWPDRAPELLSHPTVEITLAHVTGEPECRSCEVRWAS